MSQKVTKDNVREIENKYKLEIYHIFNDQRKSQLEVDLLRRELNKTQSRNESLEAQIVQKAQEIISD